jgi:hypothetical protein
VSHGSHSFIAPVIPLSLRPDNDKLLSAVNKTLPLPTVPNGSLRGFALIIALVLMTFTLLLIVSISVFVSVETQMAGTRVYSENARANAILGITIALGQLQQYTGVDTRATAEAGILDMISDTEAVDGVMHPHWTGVWKYDSASGANVLLTWLVSGNASLEPDDANFLRAENTALDNSNSVELLGRGSIGSGSSEMVRAKTVEVNDGHFAYWISGEQTKALINVGEIENIPAASDFPETIVSKYQFPHLNLGSDPGESSTVRKAISLGQVSCALGLSDTGADSLKSYYHDVTTHSKGLLTNPRSGGLKTDLSALLGANTLPVGYDGEFVYEADETITSDTWATQSPTWNYIKAYYDLHRDVLDDNKLTPRPGTADQPGISPVILMFKYGFGGGLDINNHLMVNLYPQLILYNPYSVTLEGRDYGLIIFGNQMTRQEEGHNQEFKTMPIAQGYMNNALHPELGGETVRYELAKNFIMPGGLDTRASWEGSGSTPRVEPPGAPRFLVECPDIAPGEAVIFTPTQRTQFDRFADENLVLTPGYRSNAFYWTSDFQLVENPEESGDLDSVYWAIYDQLSYPIYFDAALVDDLSEPDLLRSAPNTLGVQRYLYRRDDEAFRSHVFQLTGRIPFRRNEYTFPTTSTYSYGYPNSDPGPEFSWAAYAFLPCSSFNDIHTRPFAHFNPRAKELDPLDIDNRNNDHQHYFYNMYGGVDFPAMEFYAGDTKVYVGGGYTRSDDGVESFILYDVPQGETGLYSLGQLQHMQVSEHFDEPGYAVGNSWASPHIPRESVYRQGTGISSGYDFTGDESPYIGDGDYSVVDVSYLMNEALWDNFYFSTIRNIGTPGDAEAHESVNPRYELNGVVEGESFENPEANAAHLIVDGAFNVNSVSVDAWQAILSGLHGIVLEDVQEEPLAYPFFRMLYPRTGSDDFWAGFRELSGPDAGSQVRELAVNIVQEIKARGPFTSLADFVNRDLVESNSDANGHGLKGALQAAIDRASINDATPGTEVSEVNSVGFLVPEHGIGNSGDGIAGFLTQADILTAIGPLLTTRSDTFVIRGYGDAVNPLTGAVEGRAWCEAVVQRTPTYVVSDENNPEDSPDSLSATNRQFGRRYQIVSFCWLNEDEI